MTDPHVPDRPTHHVTRRRFLQASAVAAAAVSLPFKLPAAVAGDPGCDPFDTPASFRGLVPSPDDVLGFPIGVDREVTVAESDAYLAAVAAATDRVVVDTVGTSVLGHPIRYAIVGRAEHVSAAGLAEIRDATARIRDPRTSASEVATLAATTPAILWVIANVHGSEESGTDASLQVLYELADRDDCVVTNVLDHAIVIFIPVQNPDGRDADTRRNAYGFDLNRDTFARTQPETDARVELMRQYPPLMLLDDHEFGYYRSFFPPNNDPMYHETDETVIRWINDLGNAFGAEYDEQGLGYFHGNVYDFFASQFNDTLAAHGFQGAGMTIEVYNAATLDKRFERQLVVQWVGLTMAARNVPAKLAKLHDIFDKAVEQGRAGTLEPNHRYYRPDKEVHTRVDPRPVRHYFILPNEGKRPEVRRLVRRLQRMDVVVHVLESPLRVPDFRPYGRPERERTLPAGTYWIPMAQPQKHWIQSMLNEDTYLPTNFTYSLSGWSNPLLFNLDAGLSGVRLEPDASVAPAMAEPGPPAPPANLPRIGLFRMSKGTYSAESWGSMRWLLETRWELPYTQLNPQAIIDGALDEIDVLVASGAGSSRGLVLLRRRGVRNLVDWVNGGGRYVGFRGGGARLAALIGLSTAHLHFPIADVPGSLIRAKVSQDSPLAAGVGRFVWVLFDDDLIAKVPDGDAGDVPIVYPELESDDWFVSGFADDPRSVSRTAVCVDQRAGNGRVVIFPGDPNRRGMPEGMHRVLWNAMFGGDPVSRGGAAPAVGSAQRAGAEAAARRAALALPPFEAPLRFSAPTDDAAAAASVLHRYGTAFRSLAAGSSTRFVVDNPDELTVEEHPYAIEMAVALRRAGVDVVGFRGP
jgi:hypothetical protein